MRKIKIRPSAVLEGMTGLGKTVVTTALIAAVAPAAAPVQIDTSGPGATRQVQWPSTRDYLARLELFKLQASAERRFDDAMDGMREMSELVVSQEREAPGTCESARILLETTLALSEVLTTLGRQAEALAMLEAMVAGEATTKSKDEAKIIESVSKLAASHSRVKRRISELEQTLGQEAQEPSLDQLVEDLLVTEQLGSVRQLGVHAVAPLVRLLERNLDALYGPQAADPLALLLQIDEVSAARFILDHLDDGGPIWRSRIVVAMSASGILSSPETWDSSSGFPSNCMRAHWLEVLEGLLRSEDVDAEAIRLVQPVAANGALTPSMQASLVRSVQSGETKRVQAVIETLDFNYLIPNLQPVFEELVANPSPYVRTFAAGQLVHFASSKALLDRADDPVPAVRRTVATSLTARQVDMPLHLSGARLASSTKEWIRPKYGELERTLLGRLVEDPDESVRLAAWRGIRALDQPLADETYLGLTEDPSELIRLGVLDRIAIHRPELRARILAKLANDASEKVLRDVDAALASSEWQAHPELYLPVLRARWTHSKYPLWDVNNRHESNVAISVIDSACQTEAGLNQLAAWAAEDADMHLVSRIARADTLYTMSPETMRTFFPLLYAKDDYGRKIAKKIRRGSAGVHLRAALLELAKQVEQPADLRFTAASCSAPLGSVEAENLLLEALSDASWTSDGEILDTYESMPRTTRNRAVLGVIEERRVGDVFAHQVARAWVWDAPGAAEVGRAILDRWFESSDHSGAVQRAILYMSHSPKEANLDILSAAVERSETYTGPAIAAMGRVRDERFLPILAGILDAGIATPKWYEALDAVTQFMSDDAAEILLKAAANAPGQEGRDRCLAGLETIRAYQDAKERLASRRLHKAAREDSINELVTMIDDPDVNVRIQAIRGLGTLDAIEAIPRLIRLLEDADSAVRAEALDTLDRLNERKREED